MGRARAALAAAVAALRPSLVDHDLRAAQASFAASWLAEWTATVGVSIVAYRAGGALAVGVVGLLRMLPSAVVAPLAAPLADRPRREQVLVVVSAVRAVLLLAAAAFVAADAVDAVYAAVVLATVVGVLYRPAHSALLPSLCHTAEDLAQANAARGLLDSSAMFVGPLVATVLLARGSLVGVFVAAGAMSAASAACVVRLRYEPVPREPAEDLSAVAAVRAGAAAVVRSRHLSLILALAFAQTVVRGALTVFSVVLALDLHSAGEQGAGALTTAVGAGAVVGSVVASVLAGSRRLAVWFGVGVALWGVPLVLSAAAPDFAVVCALMALAGLGNALVDLSGFTLIARLTPDRVLARVYAALEAVIALAVGVGSLLASVAVDAVGARAALVLIGALAPVAVLVSVRGLGALDRLMHERDGRVAVLRSVPMLAALPMPAVEQLAVRLEPRTVAAGDDVVREGDVGDAFYVLTGGTADVVRAGALLRTLSPGGSFGEVSLLRDTARTATVHARTELEVWRLSRAQFVTAVEGCTRSAAEAEALLATLEAVPEQRTGSDHVSGSGQERLRPSR